MNRLLILITDDDDDDRLFLREAIERNIEGATVTEAHDGQEALERLVEQAGKSSFSLILLDINMPRMGGFEVLDKVRSTPGLKHIPIIIVSTSDNAYQIGTAYQKGVNSYIQKPSSYAHYDEIAKAIKTCFVDARFLTIPDPVDLAV